MRHVIYRAAGRFDGPLESGEQRPLLPLSPLLPTDAGATCGSAFDPASSVTRLSPTLSAFARALCIHHGVQLIVRGFFFPLNIFCSFAAKRVKVAHLHTTHL